MLVITRPVITPDVSRDSYQLRVVLWHRDWLQLAPEQRDRVREEMAVFLEGLAGQIRSEQE